MCPDTAITYVKALCIYRSNKKIVKLMYYKHNVFPQCQYYTVLMFFRVDLSAETPRKQQRIQQTYRERSRVEESDFLTVSVVI